MQHYPESSGASNQAFPSPSGSSEQPEERSGLKTSRTRPEPTHVYLVARARYTKIGISHTPEKRIPCLPSPFSGMGRKTPPLRIIGIWYCADCAEIVEGIIKAEFRKHRVLGDEWFDVPPEAILASLERPLRQVAGILERRRIRAQEEGRADLA